MPTSEATPTLEAALALARKELDLLVAIDAIRDGASDPTAMLAAIVALLAERLEAGWCALFLLDRQTGAAALKALHAPDPHFAPLASVIPSALADRAAHLPGLAIWEAGAVLPSAAQAGIPPAAQLAAVPVIMGVDERLGAVLLARARRPFGPDDAHLLKAAEGQIDSAIVQGYLYERLHLSAQELQASLVHQDRLRALQSKLNWKQKELDLVTAIDAIRDRAGAPDAMLAAIVELLAEQFRAEVCALYLLDRERDALTLAAARDRSAWWGQLEPAAAQRLGAAAARLDEVALWTARDVLPDAAPVPAEVGFAAAPIILGTDERLGAVLLARGRAPFEPAEVELLKTAEGQIDSAVIQGYAQSRLDLKQRELDLIMAIDAIRDSGAGPAGMLGAIVERLAEEFAADLCLLYLYDHKRDTLSLRAVRDRSPWWQSLADGLVQPLAERAFRLEAVAQWPADDLLPEAARDRVPAAVQWAAAPIVMGAGERLGAILLARAGRPFERGEIQLLKTAEDHVDSAVMEGYLKSKLDWKQKELDFITAIDRIRDSAAEPAAMLSAIVTLVADQLEAEACLLFLLDPETQAVELKAMHDRSQNWDRLARLVTPALAARAVRLPEIEVWDGRELRGEAGALHLVAVPIRMGQQRLGALLVARSQSAFSPGDLLLLQIAEDQVDSAIVQGYAYEKLRQHTLELETIFRIDRIRDQGLPLDKMLDAVVRELRATIEAEIGFIMLYDRAGRELEMRASTHHDLLQSLPYYDSINRVIREALERAELVHYPDIGGPLRSIMCLPLILNENIIGVLGMLNRHGAQGFTSVDRRLLSAIGSQIDTAIYERSEIGLLRQVLGRAIDPHVLDRLLANPDVDFLKGELLELTVLYADLRGSTALAEHTEPALLVEFIKDYLSDMTDVILRHEGTVDKFVGDEVMALFGAPIPQADHAARAVRVGLAMQRAYAAVQARWQARGVAAPPIGIGIATGEMIAGEMGSAQRAAYTVIGRAANLGARICSAAKGGQVLISQTTYELAADVVQAVPLPGQHFKGVAEDVTVYQVHAVSR